jgi:hypothetical protein
MQVALKHSWPPNKGVSQQKLPTMAARNLLLQRQQRLLLPTASLSGGSDH